MTEHSKAASGRKCPVCKRRDFEPCLRDDCPREHSKAACDLVWLGCHGGCGWPEQQCVIRAWGNRPEENPHLACGERDEPDREPLEVAIPGRGKASRAKVCPLCGDRYFNAGAHAEACRGPIPTPNRGTES